jgi:hypothetical protein
MTFPHIDTYVSKFKGLARMAGYTQGSPEVIHLFLKGLPRSIVQGAMAPPTPHDYRSIKQRAIEATQAQEVISNILREQGEGFGKDIFRNTTRPQQRRPFFSTNQQNTYQNTRREANPYTSSNAPPWMANQPVAMDTSARGRAPPPRNNNWRTRTQGNTVQTNQANDRRCFNCGIAGHFARDC